MADEARSLQTQQLDVNKVPLTAAPFLEHGREWAIIAQVMKQTKGASFAPLLPLLFRLRGKPLTLRNHFAFSPVFRTRMARRMQLKAARQCGKSVCQALRGILMGISVPHFTQLCVTPLFEQIRRFSNNYVRPFINNSPFRHMILGRQTDNNVLQRTFYNESSMIFSFGFLDMERVRGVAAQGLSVDECQGLDKDFLPILMECLSGSEDWGMTMYSGTPKSLDNTVESTWVQTSQAEFCVRCMACNHWNVPTLTHDLDKMIGPWRADISEEKPGIVCGKCSRPVSPREHGRWIHAYPERRFDFPGLHIPQIIMPGHYAHPDKWRTLVGKRDGMAATTPAAFYNEVCAESYDIGAKIVTVTQLKQAATLHVNTLENATAATDNYIQRVMAIDWGGYGERMTSFTVMTVLGMTNSGEIHVIWGKRFNMPHAHHEEARLILEIMGTLGCGHLTHDYTGAGADREDYIVDAGLPLSSIIPVAYVRSAAGPIFQFKPATRIHPRNHYRADKTRSLQLTCHQIKQGRLKFFAYDHRGADDPGLLHDFLALVEEKLDSRVGRDVYLVTRNQAMSDDFAQAVNIGCCALWHMLDRWPRVAEIDDMQITPALEQWLDSDRDYNAEDY